jgi:hypothetical protein
MISHRCRILRNFACAYRKSHPAIRFLHLNGIAKSFSFYGAGSRRSPILVGLKSASNSVTSSAGCHERIRCGERLEFKLNSTCWALRSRNPSSPNIGSRRQGLPRRPERPFFAIMPARLSLSTFSQFRPPSSATFTVSSSFRTSAGKSCTSTSQPTQLQLGRRGRLWRHSLKIPRRVFCFEIEIRFTAKSSAVG